MSQNSFSPTISDPTDSPPIQRTRRKKVRREALGPAVAVYSAQKLHWRVVFLVFLPGWLAVLAPLGYGVYRANYAYTHYGPVAAQAWSQPWYTLSIITLFFVTLLTLYRVRRSRRFIAFHQNGLLIALSRPKILLWEQITGISTDIRQDHFFSLPLSRSFRASLYTDRGDAIRLDGSLQNLPELVTRLKALLYPRLAPRLFEDFEAGRRLQFGPLAIHAETITIRNRSVPWSQVRQITVRTGSLVVELANHHSLHLPVAQIPNLELLLQLIQKGVKA